MRLAGQVAIVTGASAGIGLAVARKLVAAGARVAMVARTQETLEREAAAIDPRGEATRAFPLDVRDLAALEALPARVVAAMGRLDILVNNAGMNHRGPMRTLPARAMSDIILANLSAPMILTRAAVEHLPPGGAVVNLASLAGMVPVPDEAAYCASKAGLRAFTRAIADEMPSLRIATVCPGPVDTGFFGDDLAHVPDFVFSQPISTADQVADAVLACIAGGSREIAVPRMSGLLATTGYLFPSLARVLRPMLAKRGAEAKRRFMQRRSGG